MAIADVLKHLVARFKTIDIGWRWHEATLPHAIILYCTREFIRLWYNMRNRPWQQGNCTHEIFENIISWLRPWCKVLGCSHNA